MGRPSNTYKGSPKGDLRQKEKVIPSFRAEENFPFRFSQRENPSSEYHDPMTSQVQGGIDHAVLDDIIRRLTEVRLARPGKQVQLSESEIKQLCVASRDIFLQQPILLELEAPIKICGTTMHAHN